MWAGVRLLVTLLSLIASKTKFFSRLLKIGSFPRFIVQLCCSCWRCLTSINAQLNFFAAHVARRGDFPRFPRSSDAVDFVMLFLTACPLVTHEPAQYILLQLATLCSFGMNPFQDIANIFLRAGTWWFGILV